MKKAAWNDFPDGLIAFDDPASPTDRREGRPVTTFRAPKQGLIGKVATGLGCSTVVSILFSFGGVKWIALRLFAAILQSCNPRDNK